MSVATAPQPRVRVSDRIKSLFGSVAKVQAIETEQNVSSYEELVAAIAAVEVDPEAATPEPEDVHDIITAAGRTVDELDRDVALATEAAKLRDELAGEVDARKAAEKASRAYADHEKAFQEYVTSARKKGTELDNERRRCNHRLEHFRSVRSRLEAIVGTVSDREIEIGREIRTLQGLEISLRRGCEGSLTEQHILIRQEDSEDVKALRALDEEIAEIESKFDGETRNWSRTSSLKERRDRLDRKVRKAKRFYKAGAEVADIRKQIADLSAERDQLAAQRRKMLG